MYFGFWTDHVVVKAYHNVEMVIVSWVLNDHLDVASYSHNVVAV